MNNNLQQLFAIAQKKAKMIIGLDVALCRFSGSGMQTWFKLPEFETVDYDDFFGKDCAGFSPKSWLIWRS